MKELKISKMLLMAFGAPLIFMVIYIWSLRFKQYVPPFFCFLLISLFVLAPLEIISLLRENKKENGNAGIECALLYHQKLHKGKALFIVVVLFCIAGIASKFIGAWENSLVMPYVYIVWKKENLYIGIMVHCLCNLVSSMEILIIVLRAIG